MFDVRKLQAALTERGFNPGTIDGVMGQKTLAAWQNWTAKELDFGPAPMVSGTPWYTEALRQLGKHERRDNSYLKNWFYKSVSWIDPGDTPWCGAFVETCVRMTLPMETTPKNSLGAREWMKFGTEISEPSLGAVMVFWRGSKKGWKGHVGFYAGEDDSTYHVLGGNQSNAVTITRISKNRLLSTRWPVTAEAPTSGRQSRTDTSAVSHNEA